MSDYIIYGKIIIDDIRLKNGELVRSILGGGGPQAAFGSRLWGDKVGFLSRSGTDLSKEHIDMLQGLDINLDGWNQYNNFKTPKAEMIYDEKEYVIGGGLVSDRSEFAQLLSQVIELPKTYKQPTAIHLITEFPEEPMVKTALELREGGTIFSLEPLMWDRSGQYKGSMLDLFTKVDIVTPDWPAASGLAKSENPYEVLRYWSQLGPKMVAIRHGGNGSYTWDQKNDQFWHIPIVKVDVIDPTGAGNAYGGGLVVGWSKTGDSKIAGCYGTISAAFLVRRYGLPKVTSALTNEAIQKLDNLLTEVSLLQISPSVS